MGRCAVLHVLAIVLLVGCASDAGRASTAPTRVATSPVAAVAVAEPVGEPVALRRRHREGDRYEVVTSFDLGDTPVHPDLGYTTWADAELLLDGDGGLIARGVFRKSQLRHGDALNPLGEESNLAGVGVTLWLDDRNRVSRDELVGQSVDNAGFARVVVDSLRAVRVYYPDAPVPVGGSWTAEPVHWDTRPAGWVVVKVQPTYTLEAVALRGGRRTAHIRWTAVAEIEPFEVGVLTLRARVPIDGTSTIDLEDGYTGEHDIRGRVELSLAGSAGHVSDVASVRLIQRVTRR